MSSVNEELNSSSRRFEWQRLCRSRSRFEEVAEMILKNKLDVHMRDEWGLSAVMYSAIGFKRKPSLKTFEYLFEQQHQPLTCEERIDGLKLLGSCHILKNKFEEGLKCWKRSSEFQFQWQDLSSEESASTNGDQVKPEWVNLNDILQMEKEMDTIDGRISLVYQAVIIRFRISKSFFMDHDWCLYSMIRNCIENWYDVRKCMMHLLKWDLIYGSHSLDEIGHRFSGSAVVLLAGSQFHEEMDPEWASYSYLATFENYIVILEWLAIYLEDVLERMAEDDHKKIAKNDPVIVTGIRMITVVETVSLLCDMKLNEEKRNRFIQVLRRILAVDWRDASGRSLLLSTCFWMTFYHRFSSDEAREFERNNDSPFFRYISHESIEALLEAGADVNAVDVDNNTCLHFLITEKADPSELSIISRLLDKGAYCDALNNQNESPQSLAINLWKKELISPSSPYFCLQWLCARVLRRSRDRILNSNFIPNRILGYLKMQ